MTDKTQPRDWSDICKQLNMIALQCTAKLTPFDCPKFYKEALAILQEFDAQNQPVCAGTPPTEEPLELVIGGMYQNKDGDELEFLGLNTHRKDFYPYTFIDVESGFTVHHSKSEIRKHTPKPVEHTYSMEEIVEELDTWQEEPISPKHFCIRGKIIRQLLKELGEGLDAEPKNEHVHNYKHRNRGEGDTYFCDCGDSY